MVRLWDVIWIAVIAGVGFLNRLLVLVDELPEPRVKPPDLHLDPLPGEMLQPAGDHGGGNLTAARTACWCRRAARRLVAERGEDRGTCRRVEEGVKDEQGEPAAGRRLCRRCQGSVRENNVQNHTIVMGIARMAVRLPVTCRPVQLHITLVRHGADTDPGPCEIRPAVVIGYAGGEDRNRPAVTGGKPVGGEKPPLPDLLQEPLGKIHRRAPEEER